MTFDAQKVRELEELQNRVSQLEAEMRVSGSVEPWPPQGFYSAYYATTGFMLGGFGAAFSLLANVIGAPLAGKSPLELIRVYLTFPLGERALELASGTKDVYVIGDGVMLAIGCCLYLATGMILGAPFFVALVRLTQSQSFAYRFVIATVLAVALWVINFWLILSWLQPLLFGGNWITNSQYLPSWVALSTHLVFGWTLALLYPWGAFQAYTRPPLESVPS